MYRKTVAYRMKIHASGATIARYSNRRMAMAATTTATVSRNALHATRTLGSLGSRARRSRSPAQRFGHAETWTRTATQAISTSPYTGPESRIEMVQRPDATEDQNSATLAARRKAARRSPRGQKTRAVAARREGRRPMAGPSLRALGPKDLLHEGIAIVKLQKNVKLT